MTTRQQIDQAIERIRQDTELVPSVAFVLGSGLGDLTQDIEGVAIPYAEIPGFPVSTAPSHAGMLHIGTLFGVKVVAMQGRVHMYEGYSPQQVAFPMQVMAALGAEVALLTNAAGGINVDYDVTDLAVVEDHLSFANFAGNDPMRGANDETIGPRFVSMNGAYDKSLIEIAHEAAKQSDLVLRQGVYTFVVGPTLESPAEIRALRSLGCDLVGMSTVPEVIAARHSDLRVLVISSVTNSCVSDVNDDHITNEAEVWEAITLIKPKLQQLIAKLLPMLA